MASSMKMNRDNGKSVAKHSLTTKLLPTASTKSIKSTTSTRRRRLSRILDDIGEEPEPGHGKTGDGDGSDGDNDEDNDQYEGDSNPRSSTLLRRKKKKRQKGQLWIDFKNGLKYCGSVIKFLITHPTWQMRKRQATVIVACLSQMANILTIFMASTTPNTMYTRVYNLTTGEFYMEVFMFLFDLTLTSTAYTGSAWHAIPWLSFAPIYWIHILFGIGYFAATPPTNIYETVRLYDLLTRAVVLPYFYLVIYATFGYLVTKLRTGITYDPKEEHVPLITPGLIRQIQKMALKEGMTAPEALLYIYKSTGTNLGATKTAMKFDPNARLPQYRGT